MSSTFLQLTNKVLRRINEVELTETTFPSARGIHAAVKDAINDTISSIFKVGWEWPFNAVIASDSLSTGIDEYTYPTNRTVDWNSFQIRNDGTLSEESQTLKPINKWQWFQYLKDKADDAGSDEREMPKYVFPLLGSSSGGGEQKFGVYPVPDKDYEYTYRYFVTSHDTSQYELNLHSDTSRIPVEYEYVIIQGALSKMYHFLENVEKAVIFQNDYEASIKDMKRILIPEDFYMESTMINLGGNIASGGFYWGEPS